MKEVACYDCGAPYESLGLDVVLPLEQWFLISPTGNDGGILCGSCIAKRASDIPGATAIFATVVVTPAQTAGQ